MIRRHHPVISAALLVIVANLTGCLGGGTVSTPSHFYTLNVSDQTAAADPSQITVGVGPFNFPEYLDRPQIVTRRGVNGIVLAEFDRWAEPLENLFERALVSNLDGQIAGHTVMIYPFGSRLIEVPFRVIGRVLRFDVDDTGRAVLEVKWVLTTSQDQQIGAAVSSRHTAVADLSGGYPAIVDAMSRLVTDFGDEVAEILRSRLAQ